MRPRISLKDYRITKLELRWIHNGSEINQSAPRVMISVGAPVDESRDWFTKLDVDLQPESEKSGYELSISIAGVLEMDFEEEEQNTENLKYLAALNGATILYGIIRSEIASLTSNFPGGRHVLQTVYMNEIIREQSDQANQCPESELR